MNERTSLFFVFGNRIYDVFSEMVYKADEHAQLLILSIVVKKLSANLSAKT